MRKPKTVTTPNRRSRIAEICPKLILLVIFAASVPAMTYAEDPKPGEPYTLIFGTVWNKANQPVQGVHVKIRRAAEKKSRWERTSDHRGEFAQRLPAGKGDYIVWADVKTPKGTEKPQVRVRVENDERHDISLHLTE
jgi:hypothetical protein